MFYSARAIQARVVDATTNAPLSDTAVMATWTAGFGESSTEWQLVVQETLTDEQGVFTLPAWGPRLRWPPWVDLAYAEPRITFLKDGYLPITKSNRIAKPDSSHREWEWNGQTLQLRPHTGDAHAYGESIAALLERLSTHFESSQTCHWDAVPGFIGRLDTVATHLQQQGAWPARLLPRQEWEEAAGARGCHFFSEARTL